MGDPGLTSGIDNDGDPPRLWAPDGDYPGTAFTRSIGDLKYKQSTNLKPEEQIITAEPDVLKHKLDPKDEFSTYQQCPCAMRCQSCPCLSAGSNTPPLKSRVLKDECKRMLQVDWSCEVSEWKCGRTTNAASGCRHPGPSQSHVNSSPAQIHSMSSLISCGDTFRKSGERVARELGESND